MAYRLLHDGRHKDKYRKEKADVLVLAKKVNDEDVKVTRKDVQGYVQNPEFQYYLSVYHYIKLWGMPNGQGWANEPCDVLEAITALEIEQREIESDELEAMKKPPGQSRDAL